jgi:hypothetical protein
MKSLLGKSLKKDPVVDEVVSKHKKHPLFSTGKGKTNSDLTKRAYFLEYYKGNHFIEMIGDAVAQEEQDDRHLSKANYIKTNTDIAVARIVKDHPRVTVRPAGADTKDIYSARAGGSLMEHAFSSHEHNVISKLYDVSLNSYRYGTGYWFLRWNPDKYAYTDFSKLKEPEKLKDNATEDEKKKHEEAKEEYKKSKKKREDEKINSKFGKASRRVGDWELLVLDDFQVFPDPSATDYTNLKWVVYTYMADVDELKQLYPKVAKKIKGIPSDEIESQRYQYGTDFYQLDYEKNKNRAHVLEYWERASVGNPKGRKVIVINSEILAENGDNPFWKYGPTYSMPFIPFFWNKVPERFHGQSGIENQIPLQKDINELLGIFMENAEVNASVKVGMPSSANVEWDNYREMPSVFDYNNMGGQVPVTIGGYPMPSYVMELLTHLIGAMQDIAGIHEVSQGQVPRRGSQIPASGLRMIMDSEAVRFAPNMRKLRDSLKIFAEILIRMIRENYTEQRYLSILGRDNEYELKAFRGADLEGSFDIILETSTVMDSSPQAREEKMMGWWKDGILQAAYGDDPQAAATALLKGSEYGNMGEIQSDRKAQEKKAMWFLEKAKKGEKLTIYEAYNPKIFMDTIKMFMLSAEFDELPENKQQKIDDQYRLLQQNLTERQGAQQQPPPPGGPAPINGAPMDANMAQAEAMGLGGEAGGMASSGGMGVPPPMPPPEVIPVEGQGI